MFLDEIMFASYDVVLRYDRSRGVRATRGNTDWTNWLTNALGTERNPALLREPGSALELIDRYLLRTLNLRAIADGGIGAAPDRRGHRVCRVRRAARRRAAARWAVCGQRREGARLGQRSGDRRRRNIVTVLMSEGLHDLNSLVVENPHAAALHVPLPDRDGMVEYVRTLAASEFPDLAKSPTCRWTWSASG